jgi:hypothetical protein
MTAAKSAISEQYTGNEQSVTFHRTVIAITKGVETSTDILKELSKQGKVSYIRAVLGFDISV